MRILAHFKKFTLRQKVHLTFGILFLIAIEIYIIKYLGYTFLLLLLPLLIWSKFQRLIGWRDKHFNPLFW